MLGASEPPRPEPSPHASVASRRNGSCRRGARHSRTARLWPSSRLQRCRATAGTGQTPCPPPPQWFALNW
eukprot:scaffold103079_cov59-Phaeocystis_antarctica.AAC.3